MKNILVFFVILFFGQLVVGSEADWREHSAITGKGQAVPGDGQFTSQYGLCLAAQHNDAELFKEIAEKRSEAERIVIPIR